MTAIILETNKARVEVHPKRGGLISKYELKTPTPDSILWLPDTFDPNASSWPEGGLPFLFPFAGRVWHQGSVCQYALGQDIFTMPLHGFSWSTEWQPINQGTSSPDKLTQASTVTLELRHSETSLAIYPFEFLVQMTIALTGVELAIEVKVTHIKPDSPKHILMPVALGWHPYFALSQSKNTLSIPTQKTLAVTPQGGSGKTRLAIEHLGAPPWSIPHPDLRSLILGDLEANASILTREGRSTIHQTSGPKDLMQHMVTWTNQPQNFHCVEPWMSQPDAVAMPTGCKWLRAGESCETWLRIRPESV